MVAARQQVEVRSQQDAYRLHKNIANQGANFKKIVEFLTQDIFRHIYEGPG